MKIRVYYEDTDAGGIVYHTNFIKFCERARSEMLFSSNLETFEKNRHFVVSNINATYKKPAFLGDILEVQTSLVKLGKASLTVSQKIYRDNDLLFEAIIKLAFLENKKLTSMDEELINFLKNYKD